jgi:hypothetical protein
VCRLWHTFVAIYVVIIDSLDQINVLKQQHDYCSENITLTAI